MIDLRVFLLILTLIAACPDNCSQCDQFSQTCYACSERFQLNVIGQCVSDNTVSGCTLYGPGSSCFVCQPTLKIENGLCVKYYEGCLVYDEGIGQCIQCGFGTVLVDGVCQGQLYCKNQQNPCTSCLTGFTPKNGGCIDNTGNCQTLAANGLCQICKSQYVLIGYQCLPISLYAYSCYIYNSTGHCQVCKGGYNLYEGYCLLQSQLYKINFHQITLTDIINIHLANSNRKSTIGSVQSGAITISSVNATTSVAAIAVPNCLIPDTTNNGRCLSCVQNYYPSDSGCSPVSIYCDSYKVLTGECVTCKYNFTLKAGQCIDPNCATFGSQGCSVCKNYYSVINNYCQFYDPNCKMLGDNACNQCNAGYFITIQGFCHILPNNCDSADILTNFCTHCITGYSLNSQGGCQKSSFVIFNCQVSDGVSRCLQCISGFTLIGSGCMKISSLCSQYNLQTGQCYECLKGWQLQKGSCIDVNCVNQINDICSQCKTGMNIVNNLCTLIVLPNCITADVQGCLNCHIGYTLQNGNCIANVVLPNCASYNPLTGQCIACNAGYILIQNKCNPNSTPNPTPTPLPTPNPTNRDPNCIKFNGTVCLNCSNRYFFSQTTQVCVPINPNCNGYDKITGACTSCFPGFLLSGTICIVGVVKDINCKTIAPNGVCQLCFSGFYYSVTGGQCYPFNPLCKTSNISDGSCLSCYPGYMLNIGICSVFFGDPNCQKSNITTGACQKCSTNFFLDTTGKCKQINPLCKTSNSLTGICISCYSGYILSGSSCITGGPSTIDMKCQQFNNSVCLKCYNGYYLSQGVCNQANTLCKTIDTSSGICLSCYPGYHLSIGLCLSTNSITTSLDQNCKTVDAEGVCTNCFGGYYLSAGKTCTILNTQCKTYNDQKSGCISCYEGYVLVNFGCLIYTEVAVANIDPYCIQRQGSQCLTCSSGYYLSNNNSCLLANPLCKQVEKFSGNCLSCYNGYVVQGINCVVAQSIVIPYCDQAVGSYCTQCISGYYTNNGVCQYANPLCSAYIQTSGVCLSCVGGYVFQQGECIYPSMGVDPNCIHYTGSYCSQCGSRYSLVNYWCTAVDVNCLQWNDSANICLQCGNGLTASGSSCV